MQTHDVLARCRKVRQRAIGTGARKPGYQVVGVIPDRAAVVVRGDREEVRVSGRRREAGRAGRATVTGGDDDHHSGLPGLLGRVRDDVGLVRRSGVDAERQVDDADVHAVVLAVLHRPVDGGKHLGCVNGAHRVGDAHVDDARFGAMPVKPEAGSLPAMMPAMCVPCPYVSLCAYGVRASNDRSGPLTTLPAVSPATGAVPESISATSTGVPAGNAFLVIGSVHAADCRPL